jgi:hypothetical protein
MENVTLGDSMLKFYISQIIGALFGYVWMLSIPALIFFIVMALFFEWGWNNVYMTFFAGAISKWMLRGFRDTSERIKVEYYLMNKHGFTLKQARTLWEYSYANGGHEGYLRVLEIYSLSDEQISKTKELMP